MPTSAPSVLPFSHKQEGDSYITPEEVVDNLRKIGAVTVSPDSPFVWTSGRKAPIYCDNRLVLGYPDLRRRIAQGLVRLAINNCDGVDVVAGTATAGIAHAAWMADIMNLPMIYVRSAPKAHGKGKRIEGVIKKGQRVVIVEDHISTGGSVVDAAEAIEEAGAVPICVVAIFTYGFDLAHTNFADAECPYITLTDYDTMLTQALDNNLISEDELASLRQWRIAPTEWRK